MQANISHEILKYLFPIICKEAGQKFLYNLSLVSGKFSALK